MSLIFALMLLTADMGDWLVFDETDNFTGVRRISAVAGPETDPLKNKPSLFMQCQADKSVTLMLFQSAETRGFGVGKKPVYLTFGGSESTGSVDPQFWNSDDSTLKYAGSQIGQLVDLANTAGKMAVEILTDNGKVAVQFEMNGTKETYDYLVKNCPAAIDSEEKNKGG